MNYLRNHEDPNMIKNKLYEKRKKEGQVRRRTKEIDKGKERKIKRERKVERTDGS